MKNCELFNGNLCKIQNHGNRRRRISVANVTNNITVLIDYCVNTQYLK